MEILAMKDTNPDERTLAQLKLMYEIKKLKAEVEQLNAQTSRLNRETEQYLVNVSNEGIKLATEKLKLEAEILKLNEETRWHKVAVMGGLCGAVLALIVLVWRLAF